MLGHYASIIWDWNGTLLNDGWLCHELGNMQLLAHGLTPLTIEEYKKRFRHPIQYFYKDLGFDFSVKSFHQLSTEFHNHYERRRPECQLQDEASMVLRKLHGQGKKQFVLSAQQQDILLESVGHFEVSEFFAHVRGLPDKLAHSKVDLGKELLKQAEVVPETAVLIGDTLHDFEVASALGIGCVLVAHGYQAKELLAATGAPVVESLAALVESGR